MEISKVEGVLKTVGVLLVFKIHWTKNERFDLKETFKPAFAEIRILAFATDLINDFAQPNN